MDKKIKEITSELDKISTQDSEGNELQVNDYVTVIGKIKQFTGMNDEDIEVEFDAGQTIYVTNYDVTKITR